jgi:hypothetical protein
MQAVTSCQQMAVLPDKEGAHAFSVWWPSFAVIRWSEDETRHRSNDGSRIPARSSKLAHPCGGLAPRLLQRGFVVRAPHPAPIQDAEIKALCKTIMSSQQAEIDQMKSKLAKLHRQYAP